eukprot:Awhi_evm2s10865
MVSLSLLLITLCQTAFFADAHSVEKRAICSPQYLGGHMDNLAPAINIPKDTTPSLGEMFTWNVCGTGVSNYITLKQTSYMQDTQYYLRFSPSGSFQTVISGQANINDSLYQFYWKTSGNYLQLRSVYDDSKCMQMTKNNGLYYIVAAGCSSSDNKLWSTSASPY